MSEISSYYEKGMHKARGVAESLGLDGILVGSLANIRRLCGFTGSNGLLFIGRGEPIFFTDSRYTIQAVEETRGVAVAEEKDLLAAAIKRAKEEGCRRVGFEGEETTFSNWLKLQGLKDEIELVDVKDRISLIRSVKHPFELERMRAAAELAEEVFFSISLLFREGVTEAEVARGFNVEVARRGGSPSFEAIVAGGPRGALPHARPGERPFGKGDLVVFDFGVSLDGYCSDETFTACIGKMEGEALHVYETVAKARLAALNSIRAGVPLAEIDRAARAVIEEAGYGKFFGHGTGHGIGFLVHEAPTVSPRSEGTAEENMTFTVEPGIYLPGRFGVRLEDTVAVTREGYDFITALKKEPGVYS